MLCTAAVSLLSRGRSQQRLLQLLAATETLLFLLTQHRPSGEPTVVICSVCVHGDKIKYFNTSTV